MLKNFILAILVVCVGTFASSSFANEPTKDSLLAAWEQSQKDNPHTLKFEKTSEPGIYNYETDIFPYKGRLKVINILIDKYLEWYYEGQTQGPDDTRGIVEVNLLDAPEKFKEEFLYSYDTWNRNNAFHFDAETSKWYTHDIWDEHGKHVIPKNSQAAAKEESYSTLYAYLWYWGPFIIVMAIWVKVMRRQKSAYKLMEENVALQKKILEVLSKGK